MATHGVTGLAALVLGQRRQQGGAVRRQPTLAGPPGRRWSATGERSRSNEVVVPLDGSGLAEEALPHVASLARERESLEVLLVRAYALPPDAYVVADGLIEQGPAQFRQVELRCGMRKILGRQSRRAAC